MKIYMRRKEENGWRYLPVSETGRRPEGGKFHVRYRDAAKKYVWSQGYDTYEEAEKASADLELNAQAVGRGFTIEEFKNRASSNRITVKLAIERFVSEAKKTKKSRTAEHYERRLKTFEESLAKNAKLNVKFLDQVNRDVLLGFRDKLAEEGLSPQTLLNHLTTVLSLLKANKLEREFSLTKDLPEPEEEPAVPYEPEELEKLFAEMDPKETIRYRFFLGTGCREQEVAYATWQDIDFSRGRFYVRAKLDVGFTPKKHESREIKIPASLIDALRKHKQNPEHPRWLFMNGNNKPDRYLLKKFKRIALRAGLNCGHCTATLSVGRHGNIKKTQVTCETHPVCEHHYLHRLRKTCASSWEASGVPIRTIQSLLGHKSLDTTTRYLGVANLDTLTDKIDAADAVRSARIVQQ